MSCGASLANLRRRRSIEKKKY